MATNDANQMTYTSLLVDVQNYAERNDAVFINQIPSLINLAEKYIASQFKTLWETRAVVLSIPAATSYIALPARWRKMISIKINGQPLQERTQEVLALYAAEINPTQPGYWCNYDYRNFGVAPLADVAYSAEMLYYEQVGPLSPENQQNLLTLDYPQLLLFATMLQVAYFLRDPTQIQYWTQMYGQIAQLVTTEDTQRSIDRNTAAITTGGASAQQGAPQ